MDGSAASFLCRGEVDEVTLVGDGEALEEESLPPPSDPDGTEDRWGTGGALFLPRKPPSRTPFLRAPGSALGPSPPSPPSSHGGGCFLRTSAPWFGLSGACLGESGPPSALAPPMGLLDLVSAVRQVQKSMAEALLSLSSGPESQRERRPSSAEPPGPCKGV